MTPPGPLLHPPTLLFSLGIVGLLMAALFLCLARTLPQQRGALLAWSKAMGCGGVGFVLLFLRGRAPLALTFLLADAVILGLAHWAYEAHARLLNAARQRGWTLAWCAAGFCGVLVAWLQELPVQVGFTTVSLAFAIVLGMTAGLIAQQRRDGRSHAMLVALLCYAGLSATFAMRFVLGLTGSGSQLQPGAVSLAQLLSLVPGAVLVVICPVSFLSLVHERQLHAARDEARRDILTGLHNRAGLQQLAGALDGAAGTSRATPYAVVMFDIDHFKAINDAFGHAGGDAVLVHAGRLIAGHARLADFVCRYGGEEFCVLLRDCDEAEAAAFARRVVEAAGGQAVRLPGGELATFTLSAGYAAHPGSGAESVAGVIARADAALYAAKRAGRNQAVGEALAL